MRVGGCPAVIAQWQSTGGSSQRCPGFDSRRLPAFFTFLYFRPITSNFLYYSIVYFDCITAFKVLQCRTFVKGEAHMHYLDFLGILASMLHVSALPLTELLRYSALNTVMWYKYVTKFLISTRDYIYC